MSGGTQDPYREAHERILASAASGGVADFTKPDDPDELPEHDDEEHWRGRTIDAGWLADLLVDPDAKIHRRGLWIEGVRLVGAFDLDGAEVHCTLAIIRSRFDAAPISMMGASLRSLALSGSACGGIDAHDAAISGGVYLRDGFIATGEVLLDGANITGNLECTGATLTNPDGPALSADRATIGGGVFLRHGFTATGEVRLPVANITGVLDCTGATLTNPDGPALAAFGATIGGNVFLRDRFTATGEVRLDGANITGVLDCHGATLTNPDGSALLADGATIGGNVFLRDGFIATGEVRLPGANITGKLLCGGATLTNPDGPALLADGATIRGGVFLRHGFTATGEVRLPVANITGVLDCTGATLTNPDGPALAAFGATIGGNVLLSDGFTATGEVRLDGANITGTLDCGDGTLTNPDGDALSADGATIGGNVFLRDRFTATGKVRLPGANITGTLDCGDGTLTNPDGDALFADGATIGGSVFLRHGFTATGTVRLTHVSAGSLCDDSGSWPDRMNLTGFKYDRLVGPISWKQRADWLRRQRSYDAQPYLHLARVLHEQGHERAARKIRMERHNVLLRPPAHWSDERPGRLERAWRWLLRLTIGHGYEPWRALLVAIPLILGMTLWYTDAKDHDVFAAVADDPTRPEDTDVVHSSECDSDYVCVQPFVYALDVILPIVDLGQRQAWAPDQSRHDGPWYRSGEWLAAATWGTTLVGWALATLTLASFSNAVKRE